MASQYIEIQTGSSHLAGKVGSLIEMARKVQEDTSRVVNVMNQASYPGGDAGDWVALAGLLGFGGTDAAVKARAVYDLLFNFQTVINKPNYDAFVNRLG